MGKADLLHHSSGRDITGSVERCIHNGDLVLHLVNGLLVHNLGLYLGNILVINLLADHLVLARCRCGCLVRGLYRGQILNGQHLISNALVMRRCKLGAVLPIYLIAVVFRRVVAGCDVDAGNTAKLPDCKGQLRRGAQRLKLVCLNTVGCQGHGRLHGKLR